MDNLVKYVDRRNTRSVKWDGLMDTFGREGLLPMWVADMDFQAPGCVLRALEEYVSIGAFGYYKVPDSYYEAFTAWERERHGYHVRREWLRFAPGVVAAVNWALNVATEPGDGVMVLTPVYYPFFDAVEGNCRRLIRCPLSNHGGIYAIDYELFERMAAEHSAKALILSSPHNPISRVWRRDELKELLGICQRLGITVISDEIHQDFTFGSHAHTPCALAGDYDHMLISITAPSKTFNLAACQNSTLIIPDDKLRAAYDSFTRPLHVTGGNSFGYVAAEAAYRGGKAWLEELLGIVYGNYTYIKEILAKGLPKAVVSPLEGTYLMWIDLSAYGLDERSLPDRMLNCGLAPDYGAWFGEESGGCIRLNLATSRENVEKAVNAIVKELAG